MKKETEEIIESAKEVIKYYRSDRRNGEWAFCNQVWLSEAIEKLEQALSVFQELSE